MNRTAGVAEEKRKALLDGMLFEVFFNPLGVFRDEPKVARFNEVFQLQQFPQNSFPNASCHMPGALCRSWQGTYNRGFTCELLAPVR
jgi:hypothetical protein